MRYKIRFVGHDPQPLLAKDLQEVEGPDGKTYRATTAHVAGGCTSCVFHRDGDDGCPSLQLPCGKGEIMHTDKGPFTLDEYLTWQEVPDEGQV